jgi:hypothetical protein
VSTLQTDPYLWIEPGNRLLEVLETTKVERKLSCEFAEAV